MINNNGIQRIDCPFCGGGFTQDYRCIRCKKMIPETRDMEREHLRSNFLVSRDDYKLVRFDEDGWHFKKT